jgi:S-adenosylmethionine/arginine decarboxylase-like enzyme
MIRTKAVEVRADVSDPVAVWHRFLEVVNRLPGITVLGTAHHVFPGGGVTGLVVIGESHAAIHTWPERGYAWAELATCGDPAALDRFSELMSEWASPALSING